MYVIRVLRYWGRQSAPTNQEYLVGLLWSATAISVDRGSHIRRCKYIGSNYCPSYISIIGFYVTTIMHSLRCLGYGYIGFFPTYKDESTSIATISEFLSTTIDFCDQTSESASSSIQLASRSIRRRLAPNPKEEIKYLQSKHRYLVRELQSLQEKQVVALADRNPWKLRAIAQAQAAQRSIQENERLKMLLQDQIKVIEGLEKVIAKRPKNSEENLQSKLWRQAILTTEHRMTDLEELMRLQYDRFETEWIRHRMYEAMDTSDFVLKTFVENNGPGMTLNFVHCCPVSLNFVDMAEILWDHMTLKGTHSTLIHSFHTDLVYLMHSIHLPDKSMPVLSSRIIYRRWIEGDRVIIAWQSIQEDPLNPHDPNDLIDTRGGWAATHVKNANECFLSVYGYMETPEMQTSNASNLPAIGTLTELLLKVSKENGDEFSHRVHKSLMEYKQKGNSWSMEPDGLDMSILALLCDNISDDDLSGILESTIESSPPEAYSSLKRKFRGNPKEEILYLKQKQIELTSKLQQLETQKSTGIHDDVWKTRAKHQAQQAQRAMQINSRLKQLVEEQLKVVESLEKVILKRPKLVVFPTNEGPWKQGILGLENREEDLEALLRLQYERLSTEWIRHGMFHSLERNESIRKVYFDNNGGGAVQLNSVMCRAVPIDFISLSNVIWNLMAVDVDPKFEKIQEFHPNLVYLRYLLSIPQAATPMLEARLALRRWIEEDRVVIVSRSIIEDQLYPHNQTHLIENRCSWSVIHAKSPTECYISVYMNMSLPIFPSNLQSEQPAVGTLTELMLEMANTGSEKFGARVRHWSGEYEEKSAEWFELFLDLIMVAACSNVADGLKEDLSFNGWVQFFVLCFMYSSSWHLYTHFNGRFSETSLLHYVFLYLLLIGLGGMVLASEPGARFTIGLILIRVALLCMNTSVYWSLPQARAKASMDMALDTAAIILFVCALYVDSHTFTLTVYALAAVQQTVFAIIFSQLSCLVQNRIPMNIDHVDEREGCMVMVALGESVVSAVINSRQIEQELPTRFYAAMQLSLLIIFSLAIFYFAAKPPREMHAMRRSVFTGFGYSVLHYFLLPTLLAIGVGTKLVSYSVLHSLPLSSTALWILFCSISLALLEMLLIRLMHYWGRQPAPTDPEPIRKIKFIWWGVCAFSPLFPLIAAYILEAATGVDPIIALIVAASIIMVWLISETAVMHSLRCRGYGYTDVLPKKRESEERKNLLHKK
ncbi:hypothetical protein THRCLA_01388 [Thraustotheca clavata]|uniref:Transmembrane protein n=1 Tax=Thraustotheca clavata TaxID=74557 RepID=A0A1W0A8D5_9STRA|nr:hypothetical protein THRCLA_01388 [Thraustotheca clavata]